MDEQRARSLSRMQPIRVDVCRRNRPSMVRLMLEGALQSHDSSETKENPHRTSQREATAEGAVTMREATAHEVWAALADTMRAVMPDINDDKAGPVAMTLIVAAGLFGGREMLREWRTILARHQNADEMIVLIKRLSDCKRSDFFRIMVVDEP